MNVGMYPGSFDPITYGHIDIIKKASKIFDKIYVAVLKNSEKTKQLFTDEEKADMIKDSLLEIKNVEVLSFNGLTIDCAKSINANTIIRGLRSTSDFEYEMEIAKINKVLAPNIDTIFFTSSNEKSFVSSSAIREIAKYGGDLSQFTTQYVIDKVKKKFKE